MSLIKWFFSDIRRVLFFAVLLLICALLYFVDVTIKQKQENRRVSENFTQVQQTNQVLNVTLDEYRNLNLKTKLKLDSVMAANKIKPKSVKSATIIQTVYRDTGSVKIVYKTAEKQPNSPIYTIPFSSSTSCWGVKGEIKSVDPKATVNILERTAKNEAHLIVTRDRFLGFLWYIRKGENYKGFNDCGEMNFTQINIVKK